MGTRMSRRIVIGTRRAVHERRGRQVCIQGVGIGGLQPTDTQMLLDRQTAGYADAFLLAIQLLKALGRSFESGCEPTWTFLAEPLI